MVLPWLSSPFPREFRYYYLYYRGITAVTAVLPQSPSPCQSLVSMTRGPITSRSSNFTPYHETCNLCLNVRTMKTSSSELLCWLILWHDTVTKPRFHHFVSLLLQLDRSTSLTLTSDATMQVIFSHRVGLMTNVAICRLNASDKLVKFNMLSCKVKGFVKLSLSIYTFHFVRDTNSTTQWHMAYILMSGSSINRIQQLALSCAHATRQNRTRICSKRCHSYICIIIFIPTK